MIKAVLVDFYGVVYDNFDWSVIYERVHSDPEKSKQMLKLIEQVNHGMIDAQTFQEAVAILADDANYPNEPAVYKHPTINKALLDMLGDMHGQVKIALFSNGAKAHTTEIIKAAGFGDVFDKIIVSSELGVAKPTEQAFLKALEAVAPGTKPEEAIMIDDSPRHVAGAQSAGLNAIKFEDIAALKQRLEALGL